MSSMPIRAAVLLCILLLVGAHSHAGVVQYEVTSLSASDPTLFRYTYHLSGFTFLENYEFDVVFPVESFANLSNGSGSPDFDVQLFQPSNPPGLYGNFTALALKDFPLITAFSVDVNFIGSGLPGSQQYYIYAFDQNHVIIPGTLPGGAREAGDTTPVPEPGTFALGGLTLLAGVVWKAVRHRGASSA